MQSATARSDVVNQVLDREAFTRLRRAHPCVDEAIMRSIRRDVRLLIEEIAQAALDDLPGRVARRLLLIAARHPRGTLARRGPELAAIFGVSRQSLNRVLPGFEEQDLVRLAYGQALVLDAETLRERSVVA